MSIASAIGSIAFASTVVLYVGIASGETDATFRQRVVGQWREYRLIDCEGHENNINIRADGSFEVLGTIFACDRKTPFTWRGTWRIEKGQFIYTTTFSDPLDQFPVGETLSDKILSITSKDWVMVEESTGKRSLATRVQRKK